MRVKLPEWRDLNPTRLQVRPWRMIYHPILHENWYGTAMGWPQIKIQGSHDVLVDVCRFQRGRDGRMPNPDLGLEHFLRKNHVDWSIKGQGQVTAHGQDYDPPRPVFQGMEIFFEKRYVTLMIEDEPEIPREEVLSYFSAKEKEPMVNQNEPHNFVEALGADGVTYSFGFHGLHESLRTHRWYTRHFPRVLVEIGRWIEEQGFPVEYT